MEKIVHQHTFIFNPNDNGGEAVFLNTEFVDNGDPGLLLKPKLELVCYGTHGVSIELHGTHGVSIELPWNSITPGVLRKLANQLESEYYAALNKKS